MKKLTAVNVNKLFITYYGVNWLQGYLVFSVVVHTDFKYNELM